MYLEVGVMGPGFTFDTANNEKRIDNLYSLYAVRDVLG